MDTIALSLGLIFLGLAFLVQKSLDRRVSIALVVLGVVALVGSQTFLKNIGGGNVITVQGTEYEEEELVGAVTALCTARAEAEAGDIEAVQAAFVGRAHIPLHVIAAAVEDEDRAAAARLLEVKQDVEAELAGKQDEEELVEGFQELIEVTVDTLEVLEIPAGAC